MSGARLMEGNGCGERRKYVKQKRRRTNEKIQQIRAAAMNLGDGKLRTLRKWQADVERVQDCGNAEFAEACADEIPVAGKFE